MGRLSEGPGTVGGHRIERLQQALQLSGSSWEWRLRGEQQLRHYQQQEQRNAGQWNELGF